MNKTELYKINMLKKPSQEEAEEAVRTLIRWAGDDPSRSGLLDTPKRVVKSYKELFKGYDLQIDEHISRTFEKINDYDDIIMLKDIRMESICEHHMAPILGKVALGYIPSDKIIRLSKLARIVDFHSKRLQMQERMVVEIANTLNDIVSAKGVGVVIESSHQCMTTRGVHKPGAIMRTSHMLGVFKNQDIRKEFINLAFN